MGFSQITVITTLSPPIGRVIGMDLACHYSSFSIFIIIYYYFHYYYNHNRYDYTILIVTAPSTTAHGQGTTTHVTILGFHVCSGLANPAEQSRLESFTGCPHCHGSHGLVHPGLRLAFCHVHFATRCTVGINRGTTFGLVWMGVEIAFARSGQ